MITYFYPKTIKNICVALMDLFNDLTVYKYDTSGNVVDQYNIFVTFGPIEKAEQKRTENFSFVGSATDSNGYTQVETVNQRYYVSLPRIALVLNGIAFDGERSYGVNEWREWFSETLTLSGGISNVEQILTDYQPTPYNLSFTLHIMTDSIDIFSQIMENVLPYFNPALFLRVKEFSFLNIERDLKVTMNGVVPEFLSPEISDDERRYINGTIDLVVESWMYRPFEYSKLIKVIDSKYFVVDVSSPVISAMSASSHITSATFNGYVVSGDSFSTSGVLYTSAGDIPVSAIPASGSYSFSGDYITDSKKFVWFTSATTIT